MKITTDIKHLSVFKALASDVRLNIIGLLAKQPMNIKDLAAELELSSAIVTMHVKKLDDAGIIRCETINLNGGRQKLCILETAIIEVLFPQNTSETAERYEVTMPIGHYTRFDVKPTCGLASTAKIVGNLDEVRAFMEPERVEAQILWFSEGFVEYTAPNYLLKGQKPIALSVSLELGSEYPGTNDNWPSEITFSVNGVEVGEWISPGDFGNKRGKLNPAWWDSLLNQYGFLKVLNITQNGTYIDGKKVSDICIDDIDLSDEKLKVRFSVKEDAHYKGGCTIYGSGFGNYEQDIYINMYYENE